jgi:hypothetical protein
MGGKRGKGPIAKKGHKIRMERMVARAKIIAAGGGVMPEQSATEAGLVGVNNGDDTVEELTAALQEAFPSLDADLVQCLVASCTVDGALPPSVHIVRVGSCTRRRLSPPPLLAALKPHRFIEPFALARDAVALGLPTRMDPMPCPLHWCLEGSQHCGVRVLSFVERRTARHGSWLAGWREWPLPNHMHSPTLLSPPVLAERR